MQSNPRHAASMPRPETAQQAWSRREGSRERSVAQAAQSRACSDISSTSAARCSTWSKRASSVPWSLQVIRAKAHTVLQSSMASKSWSFRSDSAAIAAIRGSSGTTSAAKAHEVFARDCAYN